MPFPTDVSFVRRLESRLGVTLPESYAASMTNENGGTVMASDEVWELHPILDDSDVTRLKRTCNDVVRETGEAREWSGFPEGGVSIATNGDGDHLVFLPAPSKAERLGETVFRWDHETADLLAVADTFSVLR